MCKHLNVLQRSTPRCMPASIEYGYSQRPTDPRGTRRPCKDPISVSVDEFKPVIVPKHPATACLPANVKPNDAYGVFSLFFTKDVLNVLIKNTNNYGA